MTIEAERRVIPRPVPGTAPSPLVPHPERYTLDNGLRVVSVRRSDLPQVAVRLILPGGSSADPADAPGCASMVAALLTEGTERHSAIELNERIDALGAGVSARAGPDFTEIDLGLLSETVEDGLALFSEVIMRPAFPEREIERVRAEIIDALEARLDEPSNVADDAVGESLFGPHHPYGRLPLGTPAGVERIARSHLLDYHRRMYRPRGAILVVAGDFDGATLRRLLDQWFGGWEGSGEIGSELSAAERVSPGSLIAIEWPDAAQAEIRFAGVGMPRSSPDWVAGSVANYILGGSTITGRLGANLREDKGWTYGVRSCFSAGLHPSGWVVDTAVGAEVTQAALDEIEGELSRLVQGPVSEEELRRAQEAMILSLPRAFETPSRILSRLGAVEAFGLEPDYWERFPARVAATRIEDVQRIARDFFAPEQLVRVVVGPPVDTR